MKGVPCVQTIGWVRRVILYIVRVRDAVLGASGCAEACMPAQVRSARLPLKQRAGPLCDMVWHCAARVVGKPKVEFPLCFIPVTLLPPS